jgi:hypothetical protein
LKSALKTITKNNKRLKYGTDDLIGDLRRTFERVRGVWAEKRGTWCAIDFEGWEMDHTVITEFGYYMVRWVNGKRTKDEEGHWTIKERKSFRNGKYVSDNRDVRPSFHIVFIHSSVAFVSTTSSANQRK